MFTSYVLLARYAFARQQPRVDVSEDISKASVSREGQHTMLEFTRPLNSGDDADDISLATCKYFLFGFGGPVTDYDRMQIGYHTKVPIVSSQRICLETNPQQCTSKSIYLHYTYAPLIYNAPVCISIL